MVSGATSVADLDFTRVNDLTVVARHQALLHQLGLTSLDALFAVPADSSLTKPGLESWRERVRISIGDANKPSFLYLKRFRNAPPRARRDVRRSKSGARTVAGVEWAWLMELSRAGIRCAHPIAMGEEFARKNECRSAILTHAVPGQSLESSIATWSMDESIQILRRLLEPSARLIADLHGLGLVHRDLYLSHLFFDPEAPTEQSLAIIDLQRMMRPSWRKRRWIVKDLASLHFSTPKLLFSTEDRLKWLKHYLRGSTVESLKRWTRAIDRKARRIARHDRHRRAKLGLAGDA